MLSPLKKLITKREHSLSIIAREHKVIEDPSMGFEYIEREDLQFLESHSSKDYLEINRYARSFYQHKTPSDFSFSDYSLSFHSNVETRVSENNKVYGQFFEGRNSNRAIIILPAWNTDGASLNKVAEFFSKCGISVLRLSLPYHDARKPKEWAIAKYMVSANIGRTISAMRQAVLDTRCCIDWLSSNGYKSIGLVGISLGSCIATITAAQDMRVNAIVQLLMAGNFAEAVWTGVATEHIRKSLESFVSLDELKALWSSISPDTYVQELMENRTKVLMMTGDYDCVFLPYLAKQIASSYDNYSVDYKWLKLKCGHYTLGEFPYNLIAITKTLLWLRKVLL